MDHAIASLNTRCGTLLLFTQDALKEVLDKIVTTPQIPAFEKMDKIGGQKDDAHLVDGYCAQEWADYARLKAQVATSVCRENGKMKQMLQSSKGSGRSAQSSWQEKVVKPSVSAPQGVAFGAIGMPGSMQMPMILLLKVLAKVIMLLGGEMNHSQLAVKMS